MRILNVFAEIKGIKYKPFLCRKLNTFGIDEIDIALSKEATFRLETRNKNQIAMSWWVSPKRTRSYPYARVYDSLGFSGRRATVIPIIKDEGSEGDRDFLQWDTISLMSLLGVYTIISFYKDAAKSQKYENKITQQRFDSNHIKSEIERLLVYQSDALHWNLSQMENVAEIGKKALDSYEKISKRLGIRIHSTSSAKKRIDELFRGKQRFMELSRELAKKAQARESVAIQPKEKLTGVKATLTIKNYLGGLYFFTCDEAEINKQNLLLIEGKHTRTSGIPSLDDIKDGLLKMILLTNLENVKIGGVNYIPIPILKLTSEVGFDLASLNKSQKETISLLKKEAETNKFRVMINETFLV